MSVTVKLAAGEPPAIVRAPLRAPESDDVKLTLATQLLFAATTAPQVEFAIA